MKMKNTSDVTIRIRAELLDDGAWPVSIESKPYRVDIPPGAVVEIRDEYAVRKRSAHHLTDPDTGATMPGQIIASVISDATGGKLQPHGDDAIRVFEMFHDELPSVRAVVAEMRRRAAAERGEVSYGKAKPRLIAGAAAGPAPIITGPVTDLETAAYKLGGETAVAVTRTAADDDSGSVR